MPIARPAAPVRLDAVELRVVHLSLVSPFTTSFGTHQAPLNSNEYTQGAGDGAQRFLVPALLDAGSSASDGLSPEDVSAVLEPFAGHRMVKAGLELAVLDAALRAEGRPLQAIGRGQAGSRRVRLRRADCLRSAGELRSTRCARSTTGA